MRYDVTGMDCSADGMERLRDRDETILLAYASGDASPADIAEQWESDADSCDRGDSFDPEAAAEAVQAWAADNGDLIARQLGDFRAMADRGELNWNDESAAEFDSAAMRLYVRDQWPDGAAAIAEKWRAEKLDREAAEVALRELGTSDSIIAEILLEPV